MHSLSLEQRCELFGRNSHHTPRILFRAHQVTNYTHTSGVVAEQEEGGAGDGTPQCPAADKKVQRIAA